MAKISHVFVNFGCVYGTIEFDNDEDYDACNGYVILSIDDSLEIMECFHSPKERDSLLSRALSVASRHFSK